MKQNPIDEVLKELNFTPEQKAGFLKFLTYAKVCQENNDNSNLKSFLEQIVKDITNTPNSK